MKTIRLPQVTKDQAEYLERIRSAGENYDPNAVIGGPKKMFKFKPRIITADQAARGYNNEGRGELIGYVAVPSQHEETCRYRISTGGDPDKKDRESCNCRIGLWQEKTPAAKVVDEMRKTSPVRKKTKVKKTIKHKTKTKTKTKKKIKRSK